MAETPAWQREKVAAYYRETNEKSYLANWSGRALSFNYGLSDEKTQSLDEAHENSNRFLGEELGVQAGTRVLDAGCGVGGTSIWLAKERGARMTAVTLSPEQVELGRRFAEERGVADRVTYFVKDYMATGFAEASFDVVFNLESACHCTDIDAYLSHVMSLLADGGLYGALDFFVGEGNPGLVQEVKDGWIMPNWLTMDDVQRAVVRAGFVDVTTRVMTDDVARSAQQCIAMAENTRVMLRLQKALDSKDHPLLEGHVNAALACSRGLLSGAVTYGFIRARRPPR